METQPKTDSRLRQIELSLRADHRFAVPLSDGYSVYSALLALLQSSDETTSARVHDSNIGSLHNSGLRGPFGNSDRSHHKLVVTPNTEYSVSLGITDPEDEAIFEALVSSLVLADESLELTHGTLHLDSFEARILDTRNCSQASTFDNPSIEIEFRTSTCIEEAGSVTTMFPTRTAVFSSLLGKWNNTAPHELELDVDRETLAASVIEKPDARRYQTHSVLVNRVDSSDGNQQPIFKQGFSGSCTFEFKNASDSVQNAVTALAVCRVFGCRECSGTWVRECRRRGDQ